MPVRYKVRKLTDRERYLKDRRYIQLIRTNKIRELLRNYYNLIGGREYER